MKQLVFGFIAAIVLILSIAASEGGQAVVWDFELKRPEAQKSIGNYIQSHCGVTLWGGNSRALSDALKAGSSNVERLQVDCYQDRAESGK